MSRNKHLRDKYGLSQEDYERLLAVQGGRCAACGSDDSGMVGYAFGVDHSHASGLVRGILCNGCNNALKNVGDSVERLELLIRYLEHHRLGVSDGVVATG